MVQAVRRILGSLSNVRLVVLVACADALLLGATVPLERYALAEAANPSTSRLLIVLLLVMNLALLGAVCAAMGAATILTARVLTKLSARRRNHRLSS